MTYEFKCGKCNIVLDHLCPIGKQPSYKKCPKCGARCEQVISAPAVLTGGMSNAPLDVVIGRDAEKRWDTVHRRQEVRDKVRSESGKRGLTKVGKDDYKPHDRPLDFVPCSGKE
jgi:putative FmdB family regulatory protein